MGRRERVRFDDEDDYQDLRQAPPNVLLESVAGFWRFLVLATYTLRFLVVGTVVDLISFRNSMKRRARRFREMLERMGPTAVKAGQQLTLRADLIHPVYRSELNKLLDGSEPIAFDEAVSIVEEELGASLGEVFNSFDPKPIGSASIACVYQAELMNGDRVAVKVRRPGIAEQFRIDAKAMMWLGHAIEGIGILRKGVVTVFVREIQKMFSEEVDFRLEARNTDVFRRESESNRIVSAPRVYSEYCTSKLLVTELVTGAFLSELIMAAEHPDDQYAEEFRRRGYNFNKIANRLLLLVWWEFFESNFFNGDPHASNVIVKPDNTIVLIDFGCCGTISRRVKRNLLSFFRATVAGDVDAASRSLLACHEPFPPIDANACLEATIEMTRDWMFAVGSPYARWDEKSSGRLFLSLAAVFRRFGLVLKPEMARFFRAMYLYDSLVYRLNPKLDSMKLFNRYFDSYARKARRQVLGEFRSRVLGPALYDYSELIRYGEIGNLMVDRLQSFLESPKFSFTAGVGKFAEVIAIALSGFANGLVILVGGVLARLIYLETMVGGSGELDLTDVAAWVVQNTFVQVILLLVLALAVRKAVVRLQTYDVSG